MMTQTRQYAHTPANCPRRGRLVYRQDLTANGPRGRDGLCICTACGVAVPKSAYPEETREHPE